MCLLKDIWQCLETFLAATSRGGVWGEKALLASSGQRPGMFAELLRILQAVLWGRRSQQRLTWPCVSVVPRLRNPGVRFNRQARVSILSSWNGINNTHTHNTHTNGSSKWDSTAGLQIRWFCSTLSCYNVGEGKKSIPSQGHYLCTVGTFSPRLRGFSPGTPASPYIPKVCVLGERECLNCISLSECGCVCDGTGDGRVSCPGWFPSCALRWQDSQPSAPWN